MLINLKSDFDIVVDEEYRGKVTLGEGLSMMVDLLLFTALQVDWSEYVAKHYYPEGNDNL